jgi:hypothetical protein
MKKMIFVMLFLIYSFPVFSQTGTWSHQLIKTKERPWGLEALVKFERSPTGEITHRILVFEDQDELAEEGQTRVAIIKQKLELHYSPLNEFNLGENSRRIMKDLILWVRNHPDATFNEAVAAYDNAYPDAIWKGASFFYEAQDWIEKNNGGQAVTWSQFKTYVINNVFAGVDG